jgi:hypothetical protein
MKVLIVFLLIFFFQLPAWADCPLPEVEVVPRELPECVDNPYDDVGCTPVTLIPLVGSWQECLQQGHYRVYRIYYVDEHFYNYGYTSFSNYHVYHLNFYDGQGFDDGSFPVDGMAVFRTYYVNPPPQIGTFINPEMQCWCPPPPCLFPQCIVEEISQKFPFDIFLNIPVAAINCPSLTFFGQLYDLCWLYELLRWFKYPIAVSLLIKLAMHL